MGRSFVHSTVPANWIFPGALSTSATRPARDSRDTPRCGHTRSPRNGHIGFSYQQEQQVDVSPREGRLVRTRCAPFVRSRERLTPLLRSRFSSRFTPRARSVTQCNTMQNHPWIVEADSPRRAFCPVKCGHNSSFARPTSE